MDEKGLVKKLGSKVGSGVIFVAACFVAMYILINFCGNIVLIIAAVVLLVLSAFLFFNALFTDKAKEWVPEIEEGISSKEAVGGEFQMKVAKHMKEMESTQKEMLEVLKKQNTLFQSQIENLEHEIYMLSEKQVNQAKSIIKFNKENARQLAISERETLEHVMLELKKAIEDNAVVMPEGFAATPVQAAESAAEQPVSAVTPVMEAATVLEEVSEEDLFKVSDLPGDEEYTVPETPEVPEEIPAVEEMEIPEFPEDIDLTQLFDIPELDETPTEEPVAEPEPEVVPVAEPETTPAPATEPLAGLSSDPNAMMSPEDIAKLLASMGQ